MTDVLIKRELLERLAGNGPTSTLSATRELRAILAAPRQPEVDAISRERVQAEADAFFDWPTADKSSVTTTSCLIFARCIAGMVAAERDATIAELREECERVKADRASCWAEFKVMTRSCLEAEKERDTLRQQLAELRDMLSGEVETNIPLRQKAFDLTEQRDKLAGLLADVKADYTHAIHWEDLHATMKRIEAALAEVNK